MSAKLNIALRERSGCAYNVESHFTAYSDTGIFNVYFGTDKDKLDKCLSLTHKEFNFLRDRHISTVQLNRAKRQLKGQLAIGWENKDNLMLAIGKSLFHYNRVDSMEQIYRKIENITARDIIQVANTVLDPGKLSMLVYQ